MSIFKSNLAARTFEQRSADADRVASEAMALFDSAVEQLNIAGDDHVEIALEREEHAAELRAEAAALLGRAHDVEDAASDSRMRADNTRARAAKLRELFGA